MKYKSIEPEPIEIPAVGESFVDQAFGTTIRRISDAKAEGVSFVGPEYSSLNPFNCAGTKILLIHQDHFEAHDWKGMRLPDFGFTLGASTRPRWSKREPDEFYHIGTNSVWHCNVATGIHEPLHWFNEFDSIDDGGGECDLVMDANGDHWWALCGLKNGSRAIFLFNVDRQEAGAWRLFSAADLIDSLMLSPDLNILISYNGKPGEDLRGIVMYDRSLTPIRQVMPCNGHKCTMELNGRSYLVMTNSDDHRAGRAPNAIVRIDLESGEETPLLELDWSLAVNLSADDNGLVLVSTYSQAGLPWCLYKDELLLLSAESGDVRQIAHTRSVGNEYSAQPRGVISRDGKYVCFSSNFGDTQSRNYSDAFMAPLT